MNLSTGRHQRISTTEFLHTKKPHFITNYLIAEKEESRIIHFLRFAKKMGRNPDTIRQDFRFCESPLTLQDAVKNGDIKWGIGLELVRLLIYGLSEEELDWWIKRAITENYKVDDFRKIINDFIRLNNSNQSALFTQEQMEEMGRSHFRMIVERHTIMAIWSWIHYFARVLSLFEQGKLGKSDSPFSHRSPVRVFRKLIDLLERIYPFLQSHLPKKERKRAKRVISKTGKILSQLEEQLPE